MPNDNDLMYSNIFAGLAKGLQEGLMYRQQREDRQKQFEFESRKLDLQEKNALAQEEKRSKLEEAQMRDRGMKKDPISGEWVNMDPSEFSPKLKAEIGLKEAQTDATKKRIDIAEQKLKISKSKPVSNDELKLLPEDRREYVKTLTRGNAEKVSIFSNIEANLKKLRDPKIDGKVRKQLASQMIKTINSIQGRDAVGSEEAQRIGTFLETHTLDPFSVRGTSIGQDLERFIEQADITGQTIADTVDSNNLLIDEEFNSRGIKRQSKPLRSNTPSAPAKAVNPNQVTIDKYKNTLKTLDPATDKQTIDQINQAIKNLSGE